MLSMFRYSPFPFLSLWGWWSGLFSRLTRNHRTPIATDSRIAYGVLWELSLFSGHWLVKVCWCLTLNGLALVQRTVGVVLWFYIQVLSSWGGVHMNCVHDLRKGCGLSHPFSQSRPGFVMDDYRRIRCVPESWQKSRLGCMHGVQE